MGAIASLDRRDCPAHRTVVGVLLATNDLLSPPIQTRVIWFKSLRGLTRGAGTTTTRGADAQRGAPLAERSADALRKGYGVLGESPCHEVEISLRGLTRTSKHILAHTSNEAWRRVAPIDGPESMPAILGGRVTKLGVTGSWYFVASKMPV